ncbi:MAG: 50S ribosomal protein L9 [Lentisphaeria bacterium]|nr:50S ribosomal protein L9 [Lentisphaeria bacterium]
MSKELILLDDVKDLGQVGDVVKVADGYARNYLVPRKLATPVTKGALRQVENRKMKLQQEREARLAVAKALAEKIEALNVVLPMKVVDEEGKLYGSVTAQTIAEALNAQGIEIAKADVELEENIDAIGEYTVAIKLSSEVKANLKLNVTKKED